MCESEHLAAAEAACIAIDVCGPPESGFESREECVVGMMIVEAQNPGTLACVADLSDDCAGLGECFPDEMEPEGGEERVALCDAFGDAIAGCAEECAGLGQYFGDFIALMCQNPSDDDDRLSNEELMALSAGDCDDMQVALFARAFRSAAPVQSLCDEGDWEIAERACMSGGRCAPPGSFDSQEECVIQVVSFDIGHPGTSQCILDAGDDCPAVLMCIPEGNLPEGNEDGGGKDSPGDKE